MRTGRSNAAASSAGVSPQPPPTAEELLQRRHLFAAVPEMWDLIQVHQARCGCVEVARHLADLGAGNEAASDALFEALHLDHYLRQMFVDDWGMTPGATEFLLGRPLSEYLSTLGLNATLTPEGYLPCHRSRTRPDLWPTRLSPAVRGPVPKSSPVGTCCSSLYGTSLGGRGHPPHNLFRCARPTAFHA